VTVARWKQGAAANGAALQGGLDASRCQSGAQLVGAVELAQAALAGSGTSRLALLADNGVDWVVADLAAQSAAIPTIPLPSFFAPAQLAHALDAAGVDCLLCHDHRIAAGLGFTPAGELAAWTAVTRVVLILHETITRY